MPVTPVGEGDAPAGGVDIGTLARITELETQTKHSRSLITSIGDTNKFILVVLTVGFIVLLVTVFVIGINALASDTSSRNDLTAQVKLLTLEVQQEISK